MFFALLCVHRRLVDLELLLLLSLYTQLTASFIRFSCTAPRRRRTMYIFVEWPLVRVSEHTIISYRRIIVFFFLCLDFPAVFIMHGQSVPTHVLYRSYYRQELFICLSLPTDVDRSVFFYTPTTYFSAVIVVRSHRRSDTRHVPTAYMLHITQYIYILFFFYTYCKYDDVFEWSCYVVKQLWNPRDDDRAAAITNIRTFRTESVNARLTFNRSSGDRFISFLFFFFPYSIRGRLLFEIIPTK